MAESAFGVDHGDISKFALPGMGAVKGAASAFKTGVKGVQGPQASGLQSAAHSAGGMTRKTGQFGLKNKKALAIGGGAGAAAGGGAVAFGNRNR